MVACLGTTSENIPFMLLPAPFCSLIRSNSQSSSNSFDRLPLWEWIAYINAACGVFITGPRLHTPVTYDKQEEEEWKKCQFGYTLKSLFFRGNYIWEPEPAFPFFYHHSLFSYSILPRLASPLPPIAQLSPHLCSYLLSLYFNSDFVLFLSSAVFFFYPLFVSLSLVFSLWGSFGIREAFLVPGCDNTSC